MSSPILFLNFSAKLPSIRVLNIVTIRMILLTCLEFLVLILKLSANATAPLINPEYQRMETSLGPRVLLMLHIESKPGKLSMLDTIIGRRGCLRYRNESDHHQTDKNCNCEQNMVICFGFLTCKLIESRNSKINKCECLCHEV